jgi:hypothetical protein
MGTLGLTMTGTSLGWSREVVGRRCTVRYRERIIDGRIYLEIVDDREERPQAPAPAPEDRDREDSDKEDPGVWIGELVPYS